MAARWRLLSTTGILASWRNYVGSFPVDPGLPTASAPDGT